MKQGVKYAAGALLAALLFWFVLRGQDPAAIGAAMGRASIPGLCLAALVNLSHIVFRVIRWGTLLKPVTPNVSFRGRLSAIIVGYLTTWVIPGRLGELVRPALLSAREEVPLGPCIGTVVADRLLDGGAIVLLFAIGTFLSPLSEEASAHAAGIRNSSIVLVAVVGGLLALLLSAGAARARIAPWLERRSSRPLRWSGNALLSLAEGTEALRRPRLVGPLALHSILIWLTIAFGTWIGVRASGADVPFAAMLVLLPPLALGVALPTPGGAGGYHAAMSLSLTHLFGVPQAVAVSAGILMHLAVTLPVIGVGLLFLWLDAISFRDLRSLGRKVGALGAPAAPSECTAAEPVR